MGDWRREGSRESARRSYRGRSHDRPVETGSRPRWRVPAERPPPNPRSRGYEGRYSGATESQRSRERRSSPRRYSPGRSSVKSSDLVSDIPGGTTVSYSLGRTAGIVAAGAWAARQEIVSLLEARRDPQELVSIIRKGEEGPHVLSFLGSGAEEKPTTTKSASPGRSWSRVASEKKDPAPNKDDVPLDLFSGGDEWENEVEKQKAILESFVPARGERLPEWAGGSGAGSARDKKTEHPAGYRPVYPSQLPERFGFGKKATPPPPEFRGPTVRPSVRADTPGLESIEFKKAATPPPAIPATPLDDQPKRSRSRHRERRRRRREDPSTMAGREAEQLRQYDEGCEGVYNWMRRLGYHMELTAILEEKGPLDRERFKKLTKPHRAATGLNYVRLMTKLLEWRFRRPDLDSREGSLDGRMGILEYVEHLIEKQVGFMTPRSLMYAIDFFGTLFGFDAKGSFWSRAKTLAAGYAQSKTTPPSRAPAFGRSTMKALESAVVDPYMSLPIRIACGKLRLSIQSSTRFDDILNTPISCCEWIRRPGEKGVIGLRSRALRGKCGPRQWVASLKGVDPENDHWLIELMTHLLRSHGSSWEEDDHMGKAANSQGDGFTSSPSKLEDDVNLVKEGLKKMLQDSIDVGLTQKEIDGLRWHGAKATMTSIMQHLQLKKREVRFQGSWREKGESMPDTYLRESQTIVLGAQEKCLAYLRDGGDIFMFEGEQVRPGERPEASPDDKVRVEKAMACGAPKGADPRSLPRMLLDPAFKENCEIDDSSLEAERKEVAEAELDTTFTEEVEDEDKEKAEEDLGLDLEMPDSLSEEAAWDEMDSEGFTAYWVQSKTAQSPVKLHLPAPLVYVEGVLQEAKPKCGLSGHYDYIKAEEAWDEATTLCRRCSASTEGKCNGICEHMHLGKDLVVKRCTRRCCLEPGHKPSSDHRCSFHSDLDDPKREGSTS